MTKDMCGRDIGNCSYCEVSVDFTKMTKEEIQDWNDFVDKILEEGKDEAD